MRRFWKRSGDESSLAAELRAHRPQPRSDFVAAVSRTIRDGKTTERTRPGALHIVFATSMTAVLVVALASVGGLTYAAASAKQAAKAVEEAVGSGPTTASHTPGESQYFGARCGQDVPNPPDHPPDPEKHARCPVQAGPKKAKEGNAGTTSFAFVISIANGLIPAVPVSVGYVTVNGTALGAPAATLGVDYITTAGTVTFAAGETAKTVVVPVVGDTTKEPDETFELKLVNPSPNAEIVDDTGEGTIVNDDK